MLLQLALLVVTCLVGVAPLCSYDNSTLVDWDTRRPWGGKDKIPKENEVAVIKTGKHVRLNVSPPSLKGIVIEPGASLTWGDYDDLILTTEYIHIKGVFTVGDEGCPFTKKAHVKLTGKSNTKNIIEKFGRKFIGVDEGGRIELHGAVKKSWTKLIQTMPVGLETCGVVYNYQDSVQSKESGKGLFVMAFNLNGSIFDFGVFKTQEPNVEDMFQYFLENIPADKILVVAVNGELGTETANRDWEKVYKAVESVAGLTSSVLRNVQGRDAYALIIRTGDTSTAIEQHAVNPNDGTTTSTERLVYYDEATKLQYSVVGNVHRVRNQELDIRVLTQDVAYPELKLNDDVTSWNVGDSIVVASTDYDWRQVEEFTLVECTDCEENEIRVDHLFEHMHYGKITDGVDERAEVALLTRSILIEGIMEDKCYEYDGDDEELCDIFDKDMHGGHLKILRGFEAAHIENIELYHMGQHTFLGSYALHFHMCGDVDGNWFRSNSIHHCLTRCIVVHGSDGAEVSDNVCYLTHGHSYFLEDAVEQRTIIDGNIGLGTQHGLFLMSDRHKKWCNESLRGSCDALSTFWITHPNNYIRNNIAAGSDNTGFWITTSYKPLGLSRDRKTVPDMHAYHSKIGEFDNNGAHSNFGRGFRLDQRISSGEFDVDNTWIPENGMFDATTSHEPHDPPTPEGNITTSYLYRFRAYKNRNQNVWTKGGNVVMEEFTFADASRGLSMGKSGENTYTHVKHSLFIGESDNTGYPEEPFGRSMPTQPDEALQGVEFYQGPSYISDSFFDKYTHLYAEDIFRPAGAISHKRDTPYQAQPVSGVWGIKFGFCDTPDTNWVFRGYPPLKGFGNRDGNRQNNIRDYDGSVTGYPGTQLVPIEPFFITDRCLIRQPWNTAVCPYEYCRGKFTGSGGVFETNKKNYAMHMRRDDRPNDPFQLIGERGDNYLLIKNMSYTAYFNGTSPDKLEIRGYNLLPDDYFRVGLCYPKDSEFTFHGTYFTHGNAIQMDNIDELDRDTTGRAYFWDQPRGLLFVKMFGYGNMINHERCPGQTCPRMVIKRISGSSNRADCFDDAYGDGTYTKQEDSTTPIPKIPNCVTSSKPEGWGAPALPSQYPTETFKPVCHKEPTYPATEYVGCFADKVSDRDLPHDMVYNYGSLTIKFCTDRCYQRKYKYAAVQKGKQCYCGNEYGRHGEAPGGCTDTCAGSATEMCGGTRINSIYTTGYDSTTANQGNQGGTNEKDSSGLCGPDDGGVVIGNTCYYLTDDPVQYADGQRACVKLGGNLATVNSQSVQDAVEEYMGSKIVDAWFGLNDVREEGTLEYVDGSPVGSYDNTKEGQGTSDYEDAYIIQASSWYAWNDKHVSSEFRALCQIPINAEVPSGVSCGTNGAGMKFGSGSCYAVLNTKMSRTDAEYACYTRMGSIVDVNDQNRAEILLHIYLYGDSLDYWTAQVDGTGTFYELQFKQLYNEVGTTIHNKNAVICSLETLSASNPCSADWQPHDKKCYLYTSQYAASFDRALELCKVGTSNVVMIDNKDENDFISKTVNNVTSDQVFIGFKYSFTSQKYEWLDGSESTYTNWHTGHGKNNLDDGECARIRTADGTWRNKDCDKGANVMCQAPAGQ